MSDMVHGIKFAWGQRKMSLTVIWGEILFEEIDGGTLGDTIVWGGGWKGVGEEGRKGVQCIEKYHCVMPVNVMRGKNLGGAS